MTRIAALAGTVAGLLLLNALLVYSDLALGVLTPEPDRVVHAFVTSLAAGQYAEAAQHVARAAPSPPARAALPELRAGWQAELGHFRYEDGTFRNGDEPALDARLEGSRAGVIRVTFAMSRDSSSRLWKIERLAPSRTR